MKAYVLAGLAFGIFMPCMFLYLGPPLPLPEIAVREATASLEQVLAYILASLAGAALISWLFIRAGQKNATWQYQAARNAIERAFDSLRAVMPFDIATLVASAAFVVAALYGSSAVLAIYSQCVHSTTIVAIDLIVAQAHIVVFGLGYRWWRSTPSAPRAVYLVAILGGLVAGAVACHRAILDNAVLSMSLFSLRAFNIACIVFVSFVILLNHRDISILGDVRRMR